MANGGGGVLTRKALVLKNDTEGNGKYIAGLNEIRVRTRQVSPCQRSQNGRRVLISLR